MYITICNGNELIFQLKYEEVDILRQPPHQGGRSCTGARVALAEKFGLRQKF